MPQDEKRILSRSFNISLSITVLLGVIWISYVVMAFAQTIPVYKRGNHIGNIVINKYLNYSDEPYPYNYHKMNIAAWFIPVNGDMNIVNTYNLGWLQILNTDYNFRDRNGNILTPPIVDPPSGGYNYQLPAGDDNKPQYWTDAERRAHTTSNYLELHDEPGGGGNWNFMHFKTYLVEEENNTKEPLAGFNWGFSVTGCNVVLTPLTVIKNVDDPELNNIVSNYFPGWTVTGLGYLTPRPGLVLFGLALLILVLFILTVRRTMVSKSSE